jgi:threonine/homoserine/homoserine lactone efflux protein
MEIYFSYTLFAIAMAFTPGQNNTMLMASGLNHGIIKTLPHLLGVVVGYPLMIAIVGSGLGTVFISYPWLYTLLKMPLLFLLINFE